MTEPDGFREFVAARSAAMLQSAWLLTGQQANAQDLADRTRQDLLPMGPARAPRRSRGIRPPSHGVDIHLVETAALDRRATHR